MPSLSREHRNQLAKAVLLARDAAESGARKALEALAVHEPDPYRHLDDAQRQHRKQLRAQARQLGDGESQTKRGAYEIKHLVEKVAYDQWHRLLFARFLIENNLLIHPDYEDTGTAVSFEDCEELAPSLSKRDGWAVAADFAARDLPQIFRADDASGRIELPIEDRNELVQLVTSLPKDVFLADDALGWVYQFWQAKRKEEVNASGNKIGAEELSPVTQLFTEDYMVLFLLHNTLGAWWAGKKFPDGIQAESELDARAAVALPGVDWQYLRFVKNDSGRWLPAAGTFSGWPKSARELRVLDPCMGSGHFPVFALPILVQIRVAEEGLGVAEACAAVLRDNLFGLELDPRCTQIGAFNLALAAWKLGGWQKLPALNIACSGLAPNATKESWLRLAGDDDRARRGMEQLHNLFAQAPVLGSLINPRTIGGDLLESSFHDLQPLLEKALAQERGDEAEHELAVTAQGIAKAAEILAGEFTLVVTNVPYLKSGKQCEEMRNYSLLVSNDAWPDLATTFAERCLQFCNAHGSAAVVMPQNWLFLNAYEELRRRWLQTIKWLGLFRLGSRSFQTPMYDFNIMLGLFKPMRPDNGTVATLDASAQSDPSSKANHLSSAAPERIDQLSQLNNPDARVIFGDTENLPLLSTFCTALSGLSAGDSIRFERPFWEVPQLRGDWECLQGTVSSHAHYDGRSVAVFWENERGQMWELAQSVQHLNHAAQNWLRGKPSWGKRGVAVSQMGNLYCTLYLGDRYDCNCCAIIPNDESLLPALWAYCSSGDFFNSVRQVDQAVKVTPHTLLKVPFDLAHWQRVAAEKYPNGLPKPFSSDPTQWLFNGHPKGADHPLHVAVARLLGYLWPRQTGSNFPDCPALEPDGLERFADDDGIVCISATKGEEPAPERVRALLAAAFKSSATVPVASPEEGKRDACSTFQDVLQQTTYFNPYEPIEITERNLPHWRQPGVTYFVTFRLADALPAEKLAQLHAEREAWLKAHPEPHAPEVQQEYFQLFSARLQDWLDAGRGSCLLRDERVAEIVANALKHFDGTRYELGSWVVMPNHVHALVTPKSGWELESILHSWKSFTAHAINKLLGRTGELWQHEGYDHIVRNPQALWRIDQYIAENPKKAGIETKFVHCRSQSGATVPVASPGEGKRDACSTISFGAWLNELLAQVDYAGKPLEDWLRNGFFEQHCALFHQRPFIWHVWDGRRDGFSALVNYHKLDRANLEKLTYAYLGDWIRRQQAAVEAGEAGSDARLQAAKELQTELANILKGEPPYDIFVRWKPLARQPIGWEPDLNDGVRVNIRPFLSAKDVGKKGAGILRIRPGVKWDKDRGKEPFRAKEEFPWFWNWDEETTDFKGRGEEPDGNRWNACHYTNEFKRGARKRAEGASR